jgi:hypothetical protein
MAKEKKQYVDMLQAAAEDGAVTEKDRYRLMQHFSGRREKMELIQEINEGVGDSSFQEQRLGELLEEEAANDSDKDTNRLLFFQKYCQFFFSALVVYVLLMCWVITTIYFMLASDDYRDWALTDNDYAVFIHNIAFGLVTAVVIQELGEELKRQAYTIAFFQPTMNY